MSRFLNESDIKAQLINACIVLPDDLENLLGVGFKRAKTDSDTGKTGSSTILVYEFPLSTGGSLFCGGYQNFKIHDTFQKFSLERGIEISKEDRLEHQKQQRENQKLAAIQQKRKSSESALRASVMFKEADQVACGDYLTEKMIDAPYGTRCGEKGSTLIPMYDGDWKIWGVQTVFSKSQDHEQIKRLGRNKTFMAGVQKRGKFFSTGRIPTRGVVAVGEGVSTMLTIKMAMPELTCIAAFDAGNLPVVVAALHKRNPKLQILICGDDDFMCRCKHCMKQTEVADSNGITTACKHCGESHGKVNVGKNAATKALNVSGGRGAIVLPVFESYDNKKSDFNDIITLEKLPVMVVAKQIQDAIAPFDLLAGDVVPARDAPTGGAGKADLRLMSPDDVVDRYSLIYGPKDTMFDRVLHKLIPKSCVLDNTAGRGWDDIKHHPDLRRVDIDAVGFDATERDARIVENMYTGWPTTPKQGCCDKLLELAEYLCSDDRNSRTVFKHMMRWLAYPIQHHGAKMRSALVLHGPTRVGKNLFFEAVMAIYGDYGLVIGQSELEDKFNDWASRKLFLIANEIVARQDLFHQKNKIKALVTDVTLRINPKGVASHAEKNQMNVVFLSNESQPVVPDPDDERFFVIWTPPRRDEQFYLDVVHEINHGGIAALHDHLMNIDLAGFHVGTPPPMTLAKEQLVSLSKGSVLRFFEDWRDGHLHYPFADCLKADLYDAYRRWCALEGERMPRTQTQFSMELSKYDGIKAEIKPIYAGLSAALIDRPPNDALKAKTVRLYVIESDDPIDTDMMKGRTRKIVAFKKALNTGENDDFDG